jgi:L,D-peptidoglycan transpeptidase YkuD (ErfK/YbiS/YcfS/YnhG family)
MRMIYLKKKYPFQCKCGKKMLATPSGLMRMGQNVGNIPCPCGHLTLVRIDERNERMEERRPDQINPLPAACFREMTLREDPGGKEGA